MMSASLRFLPLVWCTFLVLINNIYLSYEHEDQSFSLIKEVAQHSENFIKIFGEFNDKNELLQKSNHIAEDHYQKYINLFNKTYNETDFVRRLPIFRENVKKIIEFKLNYINGISGSISEINYFTDLQTQELPLMSDKFSLPSNDDSISNTGNTDDLDVLRYETQANFTRPSYKLKIGEKEYPDELDLRKTGCVLDVRHQLQCGSCYSFATMSVLETKRCLKDKNLKKHLSTQLLVDCHKLTQGHNGCDGSLYSSVLRFLNDIDIVVEENDYKYKGEMEECRLHEIAKDKYIRPSMNHRLEFKRMNSHADMIAHMNLHGPLMVAIRTNNNFKYHKRGILTKRDCDQGSFLGGHAVTLVGYGYMESIGLRTPYWIIKNSWGTNVWGEEGYGKIARGVDACGIETIMPYAVLN